MLEIEIEVGDEDQQNLINIELECLKGIIDKEWNERNFRLIIPKDFDKTIRELTNDEDYISVRDNVGHWALGKTLDIDDVTIFVYSPGLFNQLFDTQIRYVYYLHELQHALINLKEPTYDGKDPTGDEYLRLNNNFFNEYNANRYSLELNRKIFKTESELFKDFRDDTIKGHLKTVLDTKMNYDIVKESIRKFIFGEIDINALMDNMKPIIGGVLLDFSYFFSYYDVFSEYSELLDEIYQCNFFDENTIELFDYYRDKYRNLDYSKQIDLNDGYQLLSNQILNFGLSCENMGGEVFIRAYPI